MMHRVEEVLGLVLGGEIRGCDMGQHGHCQGINHNAVGVDAALLQIKPLTPSQVWRSKDVARITSELFDLSAADLSAVRKFVLGMRKPKQAVKQYALLSETESE